MTFKDFDVRGLNGSLMHTHRYGFQNELQRSIPWFPKTRIKLTYSLIWEHKLISTNLLSFKVKQPFISSLCFMRDLTVWMHNPKINDFLISWTDVPSSSDFRRNSWDVLIESLNLSWSYLYGQHVFRFKITHVFIPFIHYCLLINLSIRSSIFYLNVCLNSLSLSCVDSHSLFFYSGRI